MNGADLGSRPGTFQNPNFGGNGGSFFTQNTRLDPDTSRTSTQPPHQARRGPKYPQYSITCIRLGTFQSWPTDIQQHPETMAESGFYYTGNNDHVRCFYCGIGLQNWDSEDNAFVEHARWSPDCQYLKDKKGVDFINTVQDAVKRVQMEEALQRDGVAETFENEDFEEDGNALDVMPNGRAPSRAEKKNPLLTDAAQSLMLMGYLPKVIKITIDRVLKLNENSFLFSYPETPYPMDYTIKGTDQGWEGLSSRALMEEIYKIEESGEIEKDKMVIPTHVKLRDALSGKKKAVQSIDEYRKLEEESKEMKEQMQCKICCEMMVSIVFLPCGHLTSCSQCAPALKSCPVCRTEIKGSVKVQIQ